MYIERDKAIKALIGWETEPTDEDIEYTLNEIPAADVAPVVHGEWELKHIGVGHYWECSVCHTNPCIYVTENTKFCPNCGAKMDGGKDNPDGLRIITENGKYVGFYTQNPCDK